MTPRRRLINELITVAGATLAGGLFLIALFGWPTSGTPPETRAKSVHPYRGLDALY